MARKAGPGSTTTALRSRRLAWESLGILIMLTILTLVIGLRAGADPGLKAVEITTAPVIDGDLPDLCWQEAAKVTDFYHRESGTSAPEVTTAWLAYDKQYVYVAFDCKDSHPDAIHAQQTKRGGSMDEDDRVCLLFDPFGEGREQAISRFKVNAAGTQWHNVLSPESGKTEWIGDWDSAARHNPDGYSVEIRIPFSILKYDRNPNIKIGFGRYNARLRQDWWAPDIGGNADFTRLLLWEGVKPPVIRPKPVTMLYSLFGEGCQAGIDTKLAVTQGITGLFTLNPDFRNIEQDVDSVDFTYTERWLPDSRPFFSEGQSQYFPSGRVFYSRRIGDIDAGAKMVGGSGPYKIAILNTQEFGHESHTAGQFGRKFGKNGDVAVWMGGTHSDVEGETRYTAFSTLSYKWRQSHDREVNFYYDIINTDTADHPGHGAYRRMSASANNGARRLGFGLQRLTVDDDYDPFLAVKGETGLESWNPWLYIWDAPKSGPISNWAASLDFDQTDHLDGSLYHRSIEPYLSVAWRNGRYIQSQYVYSDRHDIGRLPVRDQFLSLAYGWNAKDIYRLGNIGCAFGERAGGGYTYLSLSQGFRLSEHLSAYVWTDYRRIGEPSLDAGTLRQTVLSANYDINPEKNFGGRLIRSSSKSNVYLYYRQRVRAGMDAYLIYGDPNAEQTRGAVMLKVLRPL